jgi:hypothetical protein
MNDERFEPGTGGSGSTGASTGSGTGTGTGSGVCADQEMFADLGRFTTGAIPVDAVVRHGKVIRTRRRAVGGGALAIAAALSIGVPVAVAGGSAGAGAASGGTYRATNSVGRVTVNPATLSDGKGHFSGTVDGREWSTDFDNKNCFNIPWTCGFSDLNTGDKYASLTVNADWGVDGQPDDYTLFLDKNVARADITLQDGQVLSLDAVPVAKVPAVLFALPPDYGISKIELFDAHGNEIAYSLPFHVAGTWSSVAQWYKAGDQPSPNVGSVDLVRGDGALGKVAVTAYVGPSGPCFVTLNGRNAGSNCDGSELSKSPAPTMNVAQRSVNNQGDSGFGLLAPKVDHMRVDYTDGTSSPVTITKLGGYRFYGFITPKGKTLSDVVAFDAAGNRLPR